VTKNGNPYASGALANFSFTPNDNGTYVVTLTVTDDDGGSGSTNKTITATNVVPTPTITGAPASSPEGTAINLTGSATDPGALDTITYAWSVTKNGNAYASGAGTAFGFTPNDNGTYVVTLTATDNDGGAGAASKTVTVTNVVPTATITGAPASSPEGTAIALTGSATDPGSLDTFTYAWSVTRNGVAYGTNGTAANYSFTPADPATYVVTLTVTDKDGGSNTKTAIINVVPVTTISATLIGGVLRISADIAANTVNVTLNSAGNYRVVIDKELDQAFSFALVNNISIQGGAANDVISVANGVTIPVEIHGGDGADVIQAGGGNDMLFGEDGNDVLTGGAGNDVIVGGTGADVIKGGTGRDIMIGGLGADVISGSDGDDILIAGATAYDNDPTALSSIRAIWTDGDSYTTRVNALKDNLFNVSNLFSDTSIDNLSGNGGQDWFIADASDKLKGIVANEIVTVL
jgi:PKD repeat protein